MLRHVCMHRHVCLPSVRPLISKQVTVFWPEDNYTNNSGRLNTNYVHFAGPVTNAADPNIMYVIGKPVPVSSSYHLIELNVTNGPTNATGKMLHRWVGS